MAMRRAIVLAATLLAAGCTREKTPEKEAPPTSPPTVSEAEPNNDSKSAQLLTPPVVVRGTFTAGARADDEWFRLQAPQPLLVKLRAETDADAVLEVYDADRNRQMRASGAGADAPVIPGVVCAGTCYVKLSPAKKDADASWKLEVAAEPPGPRSEREPNNRAVDAQPLALGQAVDGYLSSPDDADWYLMTPAGLGPDQVIALSLVPPAGILPELTVARRSDQAPLATWRAPEPGAELKVRDLAAPQPPETGLFLVVRSGWLSKTKHPYDAKVAYTLEARAAPGAPNLEVEPNDDAAHATPLDPADLSKTAFLAPKGDVDWFTFKVDGPSVVRAEVSGTDRVRFQLSIVDPERRNEEKSSELARTDAADVKEPQVLAGVAVPAGDNFVKVEGALKRLDDRWVRDYENPDQTYVLSLQIHPDDGTFEREPNDDAAHATPIAIGREMRGYIHPPRDVDVCRLDVAERTDVAITLGAVPRLDLSIVVRDAQHADSKGVPVIIGTVDRGKVEAGERLVVPFEPGSYLVEIREKGRESNPLQPYVLLLK